MSPKYPTIDHVTIAGSELGPLEEAFFRLGLATDYGGAHSGGITHMALLGFADGSYIELISTVEKGRTDSPLWAKHILGDGGPCAWAARVDDIAAEAARFVSLGIPVEGPVRYTRERPDGALVEWFLAFPGEQEIGAKLPFLIEDFTPRELRVRPSASVEETEAQLTGVAHVILAVEDLERAVAHFRKAYGWRNALSMESASFEARLAYFPSGPLILAAPLGKQSWLQERLDRFGESPCAFLLGTAKLDGARRALELPEPEPWFSRGVAWLDPAKLRGARLGVVGV